jgi:SAM-dependent methyltransferase
MTSPDSSAREHWDGVYGQTAVDETGWWEASPSVSLAMIERVGLQPDDPILDAGAGASTLVDHLLDRGQRDVTVLDISERALEELRTRIGPERAESVRFVCGDVTDPATQEGIEPVRLWHDRAMLHFLIEDDQCAQYAAALTAAVALGGYALLATYALHGAPT